MQIEQKLAQNIVVSMKEIINQELNFIGTNGIIIASTDENRIGESHGGAQKVTETRRDLIIEYEGQFEGTKKGINIPIFVDLDMVGVIGITGDKEEVEKYGKIIKNMTEILIKDAWLKNVSFKKRENYRYLFEQMLSDSMDLETVLHLASLLDVDLTTSRIAVTGLITNFISIDDEKSEMLSLILRRVLAFNKHNIFNVNGSDIRIAFSDSITYQQIEQILNGIIEDTKKQLGLSLKFGVGTNCKILKELHVSFERSRTALKWAVVNTISNTELYSDLDLGIILTTLDHDIESEFIHKVLGNLSEEELNEYGEIITIYGHNNGSNYKTADELFIHKNTLQYKLIKLAKLTGYDPREIDDYVILSLAFKLYHIYHRIVNQS